MSCSCNSCGTSSSDVDNTIVVSNCCGIPEPPGGWAGAIDFVGTLESSDLTAGAEITLYHMGQTTGILTPPNASQRLYLFSYQCVVGVAGQFTLFEGTSTTEPGLWARIGAGSLAQNGGMLHRMPNRYTRLGNTLFAKHSSIGRVDVVVHGKLVTET